MKNLKSSLRLTFASCWRLFWVLVIASPATSAFELEMSSVTVQDTTAAPFWTSVTFLETFDVVPLVFALPTSDGSDPSTLRIRNVSTTGFEIVQTEPSTNDGPHAAMPTAYLAVEPGNHVLPDGSRMIAFTQTTTSFANRLISTTWDTVSFPSAFSGPPAILGGIQTTANETGGPPSSSSVPFMDVGIRNVGVSSAQVTLERVESVAGTVAVNESIGLLVIDNGVNLSFVDSASNSIQLQSLRTASNIRGWNNGCFTNNYAAAFASNPLAVASANTRNGNNGGWVRRCSSSPAALGLTIDEDTDNDSERNHIPEIAGLVAASAAFHVNFDVNLSVVKSVTTVSDPFNGTSDPKAIPGATVEYTIAFDNSGAISPDTGSMTVSDNIPDALSLCVTNACLAGGPVLFDATGSPVPPGVTVGLIEYSNDGGASFGYTPVPDVDGYDSLVNAVRVSLSGTLASMSTSGPPSFILRMATRVD